MSTFTSDYDSTPDRSYSPNQSLPFTVENIKKEARDAAGTRVDRWSCFVRPTTEVEEIRLKTWINDTLYAQGLDSCAKIWVSLSETNYFLHIGEYETGSACFLAFDWSTAELLGLLPSQNLRVGVCWVRLCMGDAIGGDMSLLCWNHRRSVWNFNPQPELWDKDSFPLVNFVAMERKEKRHAVPVDKMREKYFQIIGQLMVVTGESQADDFSAIRPADESVIDRLKQAVNGRIICHQNFQFTYDETNGAFLMRDANFSSKWTQVCSDNVMCGKSVISNLCYCEDHEPKDDWRTLARNAIMRIGEIREWKFLNDEIMAKVTSRIRELPDSELKFCTNGLMIVDEQRDIFVRIRSSRWHTFKLCPNYGMKQLTVHSKRMYTSRNGVKYIKFKSYDFSKKIADIGCDEFRFSFAFCSKCNDGFVHDVLFGYDASKQSYVSVVGKRRRSAEPSRTNWESRIRACLRQKVLKVHIIKVITNIQTRNEAYTMSSALIVCALFQADSLGVKVTFLNEMPPITRTTFEQVMTMMAEDRVSHCNFTGPYKPSVSEIIMDFQTPLWENDLRPTIYLIEHTGNCYVGCLEFSADETRRGRVVARCHDNQAHDTTGAKHVYRIARPGKPNESTIGIRSILSTMDVKSIEAIFILAYMYAEQVLATQSVKELFNQTLSSTDFPLGWTRMFWQVVRHRFGDYRQFHWPANSRLSLLKSQRHRLRSVDMPSNFRGCPVDTKWRSY